MKRTKKFLLAILATLTAGFCALGVACGKDESSSRQSTGNEPTSSESTGSESTGSESTGGESTGSESGKDTTDESVDLQGLEFLLQDDGTYGVKAGAASALSEITIPATYQGKKVSVVLDNFFGEANARTQKVVISDGIEKIAKEAFKNRNSLTSITIPDSVTSIGSSAFYGCDSITSVHITDLEAWCNIWFDDASANPLSGAKLYLNNELVTELVISNKVTEIAGYTFYDCDSLTSVVIPDSVTSIGERAFAYCDSLTSVVIPDSVTSIGNEAFYKCKSLTTVTMPTIAIKYIPKTNLQTVILTSGKSIGSTAFYNCSSLTSIEIPDSVTSIGSLAFAGCSSLTSIEMPNSVTSIGSSAFYDCGSLTYHVKNGLYYLGNSNKPYLYLVGTQNTSITTATIDSNCKLIVDDAFAGFSRLTSIEIPDSVTSIGDLAFVDCISLTSVVIGDSVTSIGDYAFYNCYSLTSVYYKGTASDWAKISIHYSNDRLTNAKRYYYSESEPTLNSSGTAYDGNYWHYVDGVAKPW